jgi:hypothetical protein
MKLIGFGNNQDLLAMWSVIDICYLGILSISSLQVSCLGLLNVIEHLLVVTSVYYCMYFTPNMTGCGLS